MRQFVEKSNRQICTYINQFFIYFIEHLQATMLYCLKGSDKYED